MKREKPEQIMRGQMYFAVLDPVIGSEQGGTRPVLVIQNDVGNYHSPTIIIAPITTRRKKINQPTHIGIPPYFGLEHGSMAMLEQIRTIDRSRLGEYVGCLDDDVMDYIDEALGISVGLRELEVSTKPVREYRRPREDKCPEEITLCLCPVCLKQFIYSPEHIARRVDPMQEKDTCTYCNVREGYDYCIYGIISRHLFDTVKANDRIRIVKDSFEQWYQSQHRYTKVEEELEG